MSNDFQQTVNLRKKIKQAKTNSQSEKSEQINNVYNNKENNNLKRELQKINQPRSVQVNENIVRRLVIILAIILIGVTVYWLFFNNREPTNLSKEINWYAVKLIDKDIYYGQISDITADPVVLKNVYYNYDQVNKDDKEETNEIGSLRLVKRGKETHGPDGTMNIVRSQILYMEPLKEDSKVLKAILEYEK